MKNNKNKFPNKKYDVIDEFYDAYVENLNFTLNSINKKLLNKILILFQNTINNNSKILICGNGGSSSVSNHFLCDFQKGLLLDNNLKLNTHSLTSNTDLITAISNDISYDEIFTLQLKSMAKRGDLLVVFSVSGNSKNIIKACKLAKKMNLKIISFVGFKSSKVKKYSTICLELDNYNFGVSEDIFQSLMHIFSQFIRHKDKSTKNIKKKKF